MDKLRLRFCKTGRAAYISHLDLMHTMQRAFARAGYALKYSEGFNPHPQISVLLPLSVGTESVCELMDFQLLEEAELSELPRRLTDVMPEGISVQEAYLRRRKPAELKWLQVSGRLEYDGMKPETLLEPLRGFYAAEEIRIMRSTKRGESETDIKPSIQSLTLTAEGEYVSLSAVISAQEPTLNPTLLIDALRQNAPELTPDFAKFTRVETFDREMKLYR